MTLLTAGAMRAHEAACIDSGAATGAGLMEVAGAGVVDAALERWPQAGDRGTSAVILCGPGGNGGDGYVAARLLAERGVAVALYALAPAAQADARRAAETWRASGGEIRPWNVEAICARRPGLIVDALFGGGLSRAIPPDAAAVLDALAERDEAVARTVAVDAPSGLCLDSGRILGAAGRAGLTVGFHVARPGHYLADGPERCGALRIIDIGLPDASADPPVRLSAIARHVAALRKEGGAHKYRHGHAVVAAGGLNSGGAARLAARAALRVGAGLVTVAPAKGAMIAHSGPPDALMRRPLPDPEALGAFLAERKATAFCVGPGFGVGPNCREIVCAAARAGVALTVDADALTSFADDPAALWALLPESAVLTPHAGEFARLFPDIAKRLAAAPERGPAFSKLDATRAAAARAGCVVLHKGADTVIAAPSGTAIIHASAYECAAPWLATAGSGDVLAGLVTGLLARGVPALAAAEAAAILHRDAARAFGPGLIADDLPDAIPATLRALEA